VEELSKSLGIRPSLARLKLKRKAQKGGGGSSAKPLRIDRLLSNRGVGSRTQVMALIRRGRVSAEGMGLVR
jgi:hypothetical protein